MKVSDRWEQRDLHETWADAYWEFHVRRNDIALSYAKSAAKFSFTIQAGKFLA